MTDSFIAGLEVGCGKARIQEEGSVGASSDMPRSRPQGGLSVDGQLGVPHVRQADAGGEQRAPLHSLRGWLSPRRMRRLIIQSYTAASPCCFALRPPGAHCCPRRGDCHQQGPPSCAARQVGLGSLVRIRAAHRGRPRRRLLPRYAPHLHQGCAGVPGLCKPCCLPTDCSFSSRWIGCRLIVHEMVCFGVTQFRYCRPAPAPLSSHPIALSAAGSPQGGSPDLRGAGVLIFFHARL